MGLDVSGSELLAEVPGLSHAFRWTSGCDLAVVGVLEEVASVDSLVILRTTK